MYPSTGMIPVPLPAGPSYLRPGAPAVAGAIPAAVAAYLSSCMTALPKLDACLAFINHYAP